jgi:hypothetical protein
MTKLKANEVYSGNFLNRNFGVAIFKITKFWSGNYPIFPLIICKLISISNEYAVHITTINIIKTYLLNNFSVSFMIKKYFKCIIQILIL